MDDSLRRPGGVAALLQGAGLASLVILFFVVLPPLGFSLEELAEPSSGLRFPAEQPLLFLWMTVVAGVLFDAFSIVLLLALHQRIQPRSPVVMKVASTFGLLSLFLFLVAALLNHGAIGRLAALSTDAAAGVASAYLAIDAAIASLRAGANFAAGLWFILLSLAALRRGGLPTGVAWAGLLVGAANLLALTGFEAAMAINAPWFLVLGIVLLMGPAREPAKSGSVAPRGVHG